MPNTNGHGPKRAILYARVSTDEQARSGFSLAQQLEVLREHAARRGYEILEEVSDPGQSGASLERAGLDRIRDLVAAGGVYVVLAQDRDRIAREPAYHYLLGREFEEHGTKIRALNDRGDDSPEGELTDGILDQLGKYERAKIAERSRRGKLRKAREGKVMATPRVKYGFKLNQARDGLLIDEEKMGNVRRIFRMVGAEGMSLNAVCKAFERERIPTPGGGKRWDRAFFRVAILDDAYRPHTYEEVEELVWRSKSWSPRTWQRAWSASSSTVSGGTTGFASGPGRYQSRQRTAGVIAGKHASRRSPRRNGWPSRSPTRAYRARSWTPRETRSRTTVARRTPEGGSGSSQAASCAAAPAATAR